MTEKPRKGESMQDYVNRILADFNVISGITYQIDGVDVEPIYPSQRKLTFSFTATPCKFKSYNAAHLVESEHRIETITGVAVNQPMDALNKIFMFSDCRKEKMSTKLKRLLK